MPDENSPPDEIDELLARLLFEFDKIGSYPDCRRPFDLDVALSCFDQVRGALAAGDTLDADGREKLSRTIIRAHASAYLHFPKEFDRSALTQGMNAVSALVHTWADTPAQRRQRSTDCEWAMWTYIRILRNHVWTADLYLQLEERAAKYQHGRNVAIIEDLKLKAIGAGR